jgi:hypothetical protein
MTDTELAGTKALGQAVMGLVERAEQTHAKVRWPTFVTPWLTPARINNVRRLK